MTISYLRFERPRSMFAAMSFGNCGYAFPCIIGAKLAAPDRPAIAYVGEGAWGMSFNEILTCVREKIPVTAVVFNNRQWGAEKKNQVDFYSERFLGTNLENPSFAAIARTMGAEGYVIEQLSDVGPALQAACKAQTEGKTTVLEMMVTRWRCWRRTSSRRSSAAGRTSGSCWRSWRARCPCGGRSSGRSSPAGHEDPDQDLAPCVLLCSPQVTGCKPSSMVGISSETVGWMCIARLITV